jgi:hypothetical protein
MVRSFLNRDYGTIIAAWRRGSRDSGGIFVLCSQNGKCVCGQNADLNGELPQMAGIDERNRPACIS